MEILGNRLELLTTSARATLAVRTTAPEESTTSTRKRCSSSANAVAIEPEPRASARLLATSARHAPSRILQAWAATTGAMGRATVSFLARSNVGQPVATATTPSAKGR